MTLERLLNKLIEKGWQPFGMEHCDKFIIESDGDMCFRWKIPGTDGTHSYDYNFDYFKIRELVSNESGLWQFVCEKELVYRIWHDEKTYKKRKNDDGETKFAYSSDYWIIQSSLCEEENIEQFLIDNIKV